MNETVNSSNDFFFTVSNKCSQPLFGGLDVGCFIKTVCSQTFEHSIYLLWVMVFLLIICTIILNIVWLLDKYLKKSQGKTIFRIVYLSEKHNLYCGWSSFESFSLWVYRTALLWVAFASIVILSTNGYTDFVFEWIKYIF